MTLREQIEQTLAEESEITKRPAFQKLNKFYTEMKKEGIVVKKEYDLPPLDTVGRKLYQEVRSKSRLK